MLGEKVSASTISRIAKDLDREVEAYHHRHFSEVGFRLEEGREVRRRTRPMGVFTNTESLQRIVFASIDVTQMWQREDLNLRHGGYEPPALPLSYAAF